MLVKRLKEKLLNKLLNRFKENLFNSKQKITN